MVDLANDCPLVSIGFVLSMLDAKRLNLFGQFISLEKGSKLLLYRPALKLKSDCIWFCVVMVHRLEVVLDLSLVHRLRVDVDVW